MVEDESKSNTKQTLDDENNDMEVDVEPEVEVTSYTEQEALEQVLKKALLHDGLRRGLHECAKALDRKSARLCLLAKDCDHDGYVQLVRCLCESTDTKLLTVDSREQLGELCGLYKIKADGSGKKINKCSVAVVTDYGEESNALTVLLDYMAKAN